jgi:hypothetical protein
VEASPSAAQVAAIAEIVLAVREAQHWRVGVLMERFVLDADMPALLALRAALYEARTGREQA